MDMKKNRDIFILSCDQNYLSINASCRMTMITTMIAMITTMAKMLIASEEEEVECSSNIKRKHCGQCEESCEEVLVNWEAKFEKLHQEWLRKMNDTVIETEKELQRAEDAHQEERRKWEEEAFCTMEKG